MRKIFKTWNKLSLVKRIIIGLIIGIILAVTIPKFASPVVLLGTLFVGALKAVAPVLVFFLVTSAISQHKQGQKTNMKAVIILYLVGTFLAGVVAVIGSFLYPVSIHLTTGVKHFSPPSGISQVLKTLLMNVVDNPIHALANANYIGILVWAVLMGLALKKASENTKNVLNNCSEAITKIVKWIINLAPLGVMGLVFNSIATSGLASLLDYVNLLGLLIGSMVIMALVINPIIAYIMIRQNPYPLVFKCLRKSGITAFFTRSSAANIPVNMALCEELGLDKDMYSVSIPLGATINMSGAAITISVMTLAAVHTLGISVDFTTALILSILAAISACGASGVAGGSLLLVPLACSLFGISNDISMQVVGVGFIIGVIQDSTETGLNSSTDALFTAIAEYGGRRRRGEKIVFSKIKD